MGGRTSWFRGLISVPKALSRYVARGRSMETAYRDGDLLLVFAVRAADGPKVGQAVMARDPRDPSRILLKRVDAIDKQAGIWLLGDNPEFSTDSRTFGFVSPHDIIGRVIFRYWPLFRRSPTS